MTTDRTLVFLSNTDVRNSLAWDELLAVTRSTLRDIAQQSSPRSLSAQLSLPAAALHVKGGVTENHETVVLKANLRPESGSSDGAVLSFDVGEQQLNAVLASGYLTAARTAAVAAVAADALLTVRNPVVALIGAGPVAQSVDEALAVSGVSAEVRVWSRSLERAQTLADRGTGPGQRQAVPSVAEATAGADLVITCTPAREPILETGDVGAGAVVLAMGADTPGKRELAQGFLDDAVLVADVPSAAVQVGEFTHVTEPESRDILSLGDLLTSDRALPPARRIILDSVGSPAVDAAVTALIVDEAVRQQIGTWVAV